MDDFWRSSDLGVPGKSRSTKPSSMSTGMGVADRSPGAGVFGCTTYVTSNGGVGDLGGIGDLNGVGDLAGVGNL